MPEVSTKFSLKREEAIETIMSITKDGRKKKFISICFIAVIGMLLTCVISGEIYSIFLFGFIALTFPIFSYLFVKRNSGKSFDESSINRRSVKIDFFRDHMEKLICADEERKSSEEIHYPFEAVKMVFESENMYIFYISPNDIVQLPKRALGKDEREKISNLISNLFNRNYKKV